MPKGRPELKLMFRLVLAIIVLELGMVFVDSIFPSIVGYSFITGLIASIFLMASITASILIILAGDNAW